MRARRTEQRSLFDSAYPDHDTGRALAAVRPATWEEINRVLLGTARRDGIEEGRRVRIDSTVTETHILEPGDSQLLYDAVRVLSRLLGRAREKCPPGRRW